MNKKSTLGQFYTTQYDYILQGTNIPSNVSHIVEPFAGNESQRKLKNKKHVEFKIISLQSVV